MPALEKCGKVNWPSWHAHRMFTVEVKQQLNNNNASIRGRKPVLKEDGKKKRSFCFSVHKNSDNS